MHAPLRSRWLLAALLLLPGLALGLRDGWREHLDRLADLVRRYPDEPEPTLRLASGHAAHGELDQALTWARTAQRLGADPLRVRLVVGDAYLVSERYEAAAAAFGDVIAAAPHNGYAHVQQWRALRGAMLASGGHAGGALAPLRVQLQRSGYELPDPLPTSPDEAGARAAVHAGTVALRQGRFADAAAQFRAALAHHERFLPAWEGLGTARLRLDQPGRALAAFRIYLAHSEREDRTTLRLRRIVFDAERRRALSAPPNTP